MNTRYVGVRHYNFTHASAVAVLGIEKSIRTPRLAHSAFRAGAESTAFMGKVLTGLSIVCA